MTTKEEPMIEGPDTTLSFTDWQRMTETYRRAFALREGQALFNSLYEVRPDLANEVRGGPLDPFYNDDTIPAFLLYVWSRWETEDPLAPARGVLIAVGLAVLLVWGPLIAWLVTR